MDNQQKNEIGFGWWNIYGWFCLIIGGIVICSLQLKESGILFLLSLNTALMIMVIRYNKYAFLLSTLLSFNPILWIVNFIYIRNRWHHPKANRKSIIFSSTKAGWWTLNKSFRLVVVTSAVWAFLAYYLQDDYQRNLSLVFVPVAGMLVFYFAYKHLVAPAEQQ